MKFLDPGSLVWLSLLPLLVIFYLMKLRRKRAEVSALFLWQAAAREARVDSFFQKLRNNLLLWLQILALLGLGLALARPYAVVSGKVSPQVALVLDVSASMGASDGRFEAARKRALQLVDQAPRGTELTLAVMGREARVVVPFTTDKEQLRRALRSLTPQAVEEARQGARSLLASLLANRPQAEAFLLSDHPPTWELPPRVSYLAHGEPGDNLAISAFQIAPGDPLQAFAAITSYARGVETVELELLQGGRAIDRRQLTLPGGARRTMVVAVDPDGSPEFELRLQHKDALAADNVAWAVAPRQRPVRVGVVGDPPLFVLKALLSIPGVEMFRGPEGDLTVWAEGQPTGKGVHLVLEPPEKVLKGPFNLTAGTDPLVRDLPLDRVFVRSVAPLSSTTRQRVLARAGAHPAIVLDEERFLRFGFDLYQSDLPLSPAFPILLHRLVDQLVRGLIAAVPVEVVPGTGLEVATDQSVTVRRPDGGKLTLTPTAGKAVLAETDQAGLYRVELKGQQYPVAANLRSATESDLRTEAGHDILSGLATPRDQPAASHSLVREWWWELALGALFLLMLEWYWYHRRTR
ncbi:MAG: hypothetical protein AMXMBFR33_44780 [Candidatus Xenobia bacterium]